MKVTITVPTIGIDPRQLTPEKILPDLERSMSDIHARIHLARESGQDPTGAPFPPYAPSTIERKKKEGKSTTVNLSDTGVMNQSSQVVRAFDGRAGVDIRFDGSHVPDGFTNAQLVAWLAEDGRDIAQYGQVDIDRIDRTVGDFVDRVLQEIVTIK